MSTTINAAVVLAALDNILEPMTTHPKTHLTIMRNRVRRLRAQVDQQASRKVEVTPRINPDAPIPYAGNGPQYVADTTRPRKVEVADAMTQRAAKVIWEVRHVVTDDEWWERTDQGPYLREAHAALTAALGGGEHAE